MVTNKIQVLPRETIDKIAAGEVVERPSSVVKELCENAIDAGADSITVELKDGGLTMIRVTDNGGGIPREQISTAFLRHATSKITDASQLSHLSSLGFRGEALSSISAVAKVELYTKTEEDAVGSIYEIAGGKEIALRDGATPQGTSIFVRQLFYNTPARRKFLKSPTTEGNYVVDLMERLALSHPNISFTLILNGKEKLQTVGNGTLYDAIYRVYGKSLAKEMMEFSLEFDAYHIHGFIGSSSLSKSNRNSQVFFVNGRYIRSLLLSKAMEEGYVGYMMQHQFPVCVLFIDMDSALVDVNVHPGKMEVRFSEEELLKSKLTQGIHEFLASLEDIRNVSLPESTPSPYGTVYSQSAYDDAVNLSIHDGEDAIHSENRSQQEISHESTPSENVVLTTKSAPEPFEATRKLYESQFQTTYQNESLSYEQEKFFTEEARTSMRVVGQVFDTYWIVEYEDDVYFMDQHAAHEKVLYEKTMKQLKDRQITSQMVSPPVMISLSSTEELLLRNHMDAFEKMGYEIHSFEGRDYAVSAVPDYLFSVDKKALLFSILNELSLHDGEPEDLISERVASMSCKAAVKGHDHLSFMEAESLIQELFELDNPFHCPHGRPTMIKMSHTEFDKRFQRIVSK